MIDKNEYLVGGERVTSRTDIGLQIERLCKNLTTGDIALYTVGLQLRETMSDVDFGDFLPASFAKSNVFTSDGTWVQDVSLDQEPKPNELTLQFKEDFNLLKSQNYVYGSDMNRLICLLLGKPFKVGNDKIMPVGSNGVIKRTGNKVSAKDMNKPWYDLTYLESSELRVCGAWDDNGDPITIENTFKETHDKEYTTFIVEMVVRNGADTVVKYVPMIYAKNAPYSEGDTNSYSAPCMKICDTYDRIDFLCDGVSQTFALTDTGIRELEVNYIVYNATGATPTDYGTNGETACVINTATGNVKIYTTDGTDTWTQDTTGAFLKGTRIFSEYVTTGNLAGVQQYNTIVTIATPTSLTSGLEGTATNYNDLTGKPAKYILEIYTHNRKKREFELRSANVY